MAWQIRSNLHHGRYVHAAFGDYSSAMVMGGYVGHTILAGSEYFDSNIWSDRPDMNVARQWLQGAGVANSGLSISGYNYYQTVESWNGTIWQMVNGLSTNRSRQAADGISNMDAISCGGYSGGTSGIVEIYNGTSWGITTSLNHPREHHVVVGGKSSALAFGHIAISESWNGTIWSDVGSLIINQTYAQGSGDDNTSAMCMGGMISHIACQKWDGTSWSMMDSLLSNSYYRGGAGTGSANAIITGGYNYYYYTEVWGKAVEQLRGLYNLNVYDPNRIFPDQISFYKPASWTDPDDPAYGGSSSSEKYTSDNYLFDDVLGDEAATGMTDYRKLFIGLNSDAKSNIGSDVQVLISDVYYGFASKPADSIFIKVKSTNDNESVLSDITSVVDPSYWADPFYRKYVPAMSTNPSGVTFGDLSTSNVIGVWVKRVVPNGCHSFEKRKYGFVVKWKRETGNVLGS